MAKPVTQIAIAGFSGKLGRLIANALLTRYPHVQIHGIVRNIDKVDRALRSHPNIRIFQASSDNHIALREALAGMDICICCYLGDNNLMVEGQKTLIDACIAEGIPRYMGSDYSFNYTKLQKGDHPAMDWMQDYSAYLNEREKEGTIRGVHVLNGAFMEVVFAPFLGFVDAEKATFWYSGTGQEKLEMTTMPDTAAFAAEVAMDAGAVGYLNVLGDRKSVKELAALWEEVYGISATLEWRGSLDELHRTMKAAFEKEPDNVYAWMGMHFQYYMANGQTYLGQAENERLGEDKPSTVKEFLRNISRTKVGMSYMSS